jgi:hypothetical protein
MNCQSFETVVNDLAREQMMEANSRQEALAHSDDCEACELRLALERRLTFGLRGLVEEMKSVSASARVEEQLLEAFRSHISLLSQMRPASRSRYWLVAAAAVLLIAFGIAGMRWGIERPSQTAVETSRNLGVPTPKSPPVAINHPNPDPAPKQTPAFRQSRQRPSVRSSEKRSSGGNETAAVKGPAEGTDTTEVGNSIESEVTTQFLPLSYASPVNLQDGGQLVRVEMPRSAMVSFGLPVNMERYGERVKADVLVSADGLARAIRFVQ